MSVIDLATSISKKASELGMSTRFLCAEFQVDQKAYAKWQRGDVKNPDDLSLHKLRKMNSFVNSVFANLNEIKKSS